MKPTLILLHGALGSQDQFSVLFNLLKADFELHSFNFSGHGGQPAEQDFSMKNFITDCLDFMNEQAISSSHFFGYSMGGYVALTLALHHPERVHKIITLGTKFNWSPAAAEKEIRMLDPEKIEVKLPTFSVELQKRHGPENWKEVLQKTAKMMLDLGNGKALSVVDLQNIQNEVFICLGSKDQMVSKDETERAAKNLPQGRFKELPDVEHRMEKVNMDQLALVIKKFLC
ncbi:MAG: alpha/beta fold hydrolase [Bacteroidota bacterium]|nr:alpha/beta fold hydrolase [Bacteroidota bacterium]